MVPIDGDRMGFGKNAGDGAIVPDHLPRRAREGNQALLLATGGGAVHDTHTVGVMTTLIDENPVVVQLPGRFRHLAEQFLGPAFVVGGLGRSRQ